MTQDRDPGPRLARSHPENSEWEVRKATTQLITCNHARSWLQRGGVGGRASVGADHRAAYRGRRTREVRLGKWGARQTHLGCALSPEDCTRGLSREEVGQVCLLARGLWTPAETGFQ